MTLPRAGGQREDRYVHLLCGDVDGAALAATFAAGGAAASPRADAGLAARVDQLEAAVADLQARLDALQG